MRGADGAEQARRKAAAEGFVEHSDRVIVGIVAQDPKSDHVNGALVDVLFVDQVVARFGGLELDVFFFCRRALGPSAEGLAKFGLHGGRIKVADDAQNNVVGMNVGVMPVDQILRGLPPPPSCIRRTRAYGFFAP